MSRKTSAHRAARRSWGARLGRLLPRRLSRDTARRRNALPRWTGVESLESRLLFDNTIATATDLGTLVTAANVNDVVNDGDTTDIYKFTVTSFVRQITASITVTDQTTIELIDDINGNGNVDTDEVVDTNIAFSGNGAAIVSGWFDPGDYYIRVQRRFPGNNSTYNLVVSQQPQSQSTGENNNTLFTAQDLGNLTTPVMLTDYVGPNDITDVYRFTVTTSVRNVTASVTSAEDQIIFQLIDDINGNGIVDSGEVVDSNFAFQGNGAAIADGWLDPGNYYVLVQRRFSTSESEYDLTISQEVEPQSAGEANNTIFTAQDVGDLASPVMITDFVGNNDITDIYRFTVTDFVRQVTAVLDIDEDQAILQFIQDINGNGVLDAGELVDSSFAFVSQQGSISAWFDPGDYFVLVQRRFADNNSQYDLTLSQTPKSYSPGNVDNFLQDALPFGVGVFDDYVGNNDVLDFFAVTIPPGGSSFSVVVTPDEDQVMVDLIQDVNSNLIVDPTEILATQIGFTGNPATIAQALPAGDYFVRVMRRFADQETAYTIAFSNVVSPDITVAGFGMNIANIDLTPSPFDGTDFGDLDTNNQFINRTFNIKNDGVQTLALTATPHVQITGPGASDFTVIQQPAGLIAPGNDTDFIIQFDPSVGGAREATVEIYSNDGDETPFKFNIQGNGVSFEPDIEVKGNGVSITDGDITPSTADNTDFGVAGVNFNSIDLPFTITNSGNQTLNLIGNEAITLFTSDGQFQVTGEPDKTTLTPGQQTTFIISYTPNQAGEATATVFIESSDPDESPFTFTVKGTGIAAVPPTAINDSVATPTGVPININVVANDTDTDGVINPATVAVKNSPNFGSVGVNPVTGVVTYTPSGGFVGTDTFTYTVKDNDGFESNQATVFVTVNDLTVLQNGMLINDQIGFFDYGQVGQGDPLAGTVFTITNIGSQPITIFQINIPGGFKLLSLNGVPQALPLLPQPGDPLPVFVDVGPITLMPGESVDAEVAVDTGAQGFVSGTIIVKAQAQDSTDVEYDFGVGGEVVPLPDIQLEGGGMTIFTGTLVPSLAAGTDFDRADVDIGLVTRTFTIRNTGSDVLNLTGTPRVALSGTNAADFTVTSQPNASVGSGDSTSFDVRFDPSALGLRTALVTIESDDPNESPYTFAIAGTGAVTPDIDVRGLGVSIDNGEDTPSNTDDTDFGSALVAGAFVDHTFTIVNLGSGDLLLPGATSVALTGPNAGDFQVIAQPGATVAPAGNTTFTLRFDPVGGGVRTAIVSIANDDPDESPFTFTVQGTGLGPEITLEGNGTSITQGDTTPSALDDTDFGATDIQISSVTHTFTIRNDGTAPLSLTGNPFVLVTGAAAGDYDVSVKPAGNIAAAGTTTFEVSFTPSTTGPRPATIIIASNDLDEPAFTFDIVGEGLLPVVDDVLPFEVAFDDQTTLVQLPRFDPASVSDFEQLVDVRIIATASVSGASTHVDNTGGAADFDSSITAARTVSVSASLLGGITLPLNLTSQLAGVTLDAGLDSSFALPDVNDEVSAFRQANLDDIVGAGMFDLSIDIQEMITAFALPAGTVLTEQRAPDAFAGTIRIEYGYRKHDAAIVAPDILLTGNGSPVLDDNETPLPVNATDFGSTPVTGAMVDQTFTIMNTGDQPLTITSAAVTSGGADYSMVTQPASPIAAGAMTTFTLRFDPTQAGTRDGAVRIQSNVPGPKGDYLFHVTGEGVLTPDIDVRGDSVSITSGDTTPSSADHTDFGGVKIGLEGDDPTITRTFKLHNLGDGDLNITDVALAGADADRFTVTSATSFIVAPGGMADLTIEFDPTDLGAHHATVALTSNDPDESMFTFDIAGEGLSNRVLVASIGDNQASSTINVVDNAQNTFGISIKGGGMASVVRETDGRLTLLLTGTTDKTNITVKPGGSGDAMLFSLEADGDIKSLSLKNVGFLGNIIVAGRVDSIVAGDIADQHLIELGGAPDDKPIKATFGRLTDVTIVSGAPIASFTATSIDDTDGVRDTFTAPWVKSISIKGDKKNNVSGDFDADLILTGEGDPKQTLGSFKATGGGDDLLFDITGDAGAIQFGALVSDAGFDIAGQIKKLAFDSLVNVTINADVLGAVQAVQWLGGGLTGNVAKSITTKGDKKNNIAGDFNADLTLFGDPAAKQTLSSLKVAGGATGREIDLMGDTGAIQFAGGVDDLTLTVASTLKKLDLGSAASATVHADVVGSVQAVKWLAGEIVATTIKSIKTTGKGEAGDFGANVTLFGDPAAKSALGSASIKDTLRAAAWSIGGPMGALSAGAIDAGFALTVNGELKGVTSKGDAAGVFTALDIKSFSVKSNFLGGSLIAGAFLGSDGILGGGDDVFTQGTLGSVKVGGAMTAATSIRVGLDPVSGAFDDGDDVLLGGESSSLKSLTVGGAADDLVVIAGSLPKSVSISKTKIDPTADERFHTEPLP